MRCAACNRLLSDIDTSRKFAESGRYVDLCGECASYVAEEVTLVVDPMLEQEELVAEELFGDDLEDYTDDINYE